MLTEFMELFKRFVVAQERQAAAAEMLAGREPAQPSIPTAAVQIEPATAHAPATVDYDTMSLETLKALCEGRKIASVLGEDGKVKPRTKSHTLITALREQDKVRAALGETGPVEPEKFAESAAGEFLEDTQALEAEPSPAAPEKPADDFTFSPDPAPAEVIDPFAEPAEPERETTKAEVINALKRYAESKGGNEAVFKILGKFGAANVSTLDKKHYAAVVKATLEG